MAESEQNEYEKPAIDTDNPPPEAPKVKPKRRRTFKFDRDRVGNYIYDCVQSDLIERDMRQRKRMARRAKLMGWMGPQDWPWKDASQVFLPIMQIANLKTRGTLENALKSVRPAMNAKAKQKRNAGKEAAIDNILDFQLFIENAGNTIIDNFVGNFVSDEAAYLFAHWVKETQTHHDVRTVPWNPDGDALLQYAQAIKILYPDQLSSRMVDNDGYEWEVTYEDDNKDKKTASVCFYDTEDGKLEAHITVDMTTHNGPCISVEDFEDIVFPARAANLQPPSAANPRGACYVARLTTVNLDTIRRRKKDLTYDLLTDEDLERLEAGISSVGGGSDEEQEKEQKDKIEGTEINFGYKREDRKQIVWFGQLDVNGDGLEEDVIVWMFDETKIIAKVALLTEIYPGVPIRRPFACASFIPTTNRILGTSQDELLESLQDAMQKLIDQHMNWGEITNTPMFFYRASSGMKNEPIYIEPGVGYPLDDPGADVNFPVWPTKDSAYAINTIALLQQFVERVSMFSDASFGRVPAGKASALRTAGTTTALLQQSDTRSEQVLRRVFTAFSEIFSIMHRLNRRFLPDQKEIRINGVSEQGQDAYLTINRDSLDAEVDFEFKATLINTNKQALSASLNEIISMAVTPFAFQAGLIDVQTLYTLLRDKTKALDLDPDKYWKRPPEEMQGPALLAEEVIAIIAAHEVPKGKTLEAPETHLQKLMDFVKGPQFEIFNPTQANVLRDWMVKLEQQIAQAQALMQAMTQFQQQSQIPAGPGGAQSAPGETGPAANQAIRGNELIDESVGMTQ